MNLKPINPDNWTCLFPVILQVPEALRQLQGRQKVKALSAEARRALAVSAELSCISLPASLEKDDRGAPRPVGSIHWSLSHKPSFTAAVVAPMPTGIDLETIRPFHPGLPRKVASEDEWQLASGDRDRIFFQYWTAKEAVLKAAGIGLKGLNACRITDVSGTGHTSLWLEGKRWKVFHLWFESQVVALTDSGLPVRWTILDRPPDRLDTLQRFS